MRELPKAKEDTNKIKLLNQLGRIYIDTSPDSANVFIQQALTLSEKLHWVKGKANALYNSGIYYSSSGNYPEALKNHYSSLSLYKTIDDKKGVARNYNSFATVYIRQGNYPDALEYLDSALKIYNVIGDKAGEANCYNNIGVINMSTNSLSDALINFDKGLQIRISLNDSSAIAASYTNLGVIYRRMGNFPQALKNQLLAMKISSGLKDYRNLMHANTNIAALYSEQNNSHESLKYNYQAFQLAEAIMSKENMAIIANNMGDDYRILKDFSAAIKYDSISLFIGQEINSMPIVAQAYQALGIVYVDLKILDKALNYFKSAIEMFKRLNDSLRLADTYRNMGELYYMKKKYQEAEAYHKNALIIIEEIKGDPDVLKHAHEGLYNVYTATGDYKKALYHYKQYSLFKDSLLNTENTKKITQLQDQFDFDQKTDSLKLENEKQMAIASEKGKEKIRIGLISGASLVCLLIGGFFFYRKRAKDRFQLQQLQLKQDAIKARLDTHFVGDTLTVINEFAEANNKEAASDYLLKFSRLIRNVLSNSFERDVPLKNEIQLLDDYFHLFKLKYPEGHITYNLSIDPAIDAANTLVPPMILQVLAENSLQHAFNVAQGGALTIQIKKADNTLYCTVEDNGIGRKAAQKSFSPDRRQSYGTSLAEKLLKVWLPGDKRAHFNIEDIKNAEGAAQGTKATFSFPFKTT